MKKVNTGDANDVFEKLIRKFSGENDYALEHLSRYMHTLKNMPQKKEITTQGGEAKVLEMGTSLVFPGILMDEFGYDSVDVTHFSSDIQKGEFALPLRFDSKCRILKAFNIDLESDALPRESGFYDLILCFEIIEHMEIDPMHLFSEINRLLKPGGILYMSTPNSISARNVNKILKGYAPHFFMKYSRDRSYYRHNIEYDPHQLLSMANSAGLSVNKFWTENCFESDMPEILDFLSKNQLPTQHRGDNMFLIASKRENVVNRYPDEVYF